MERARNLNQTLCEKRLQEEAPRVEHGIKSKSRSAPLEWRWPHFVVKKSVCRPRWMLTTCFHGFWLKKRSRDLSTKSVDSIFFFYTSQKNPAPFLLAELLLSRRHHNPEMASRNSWGRAEHSKMRSDRGAFEVSAACVPLLTPHSS